MTDQKRWMARTAGTKLPYSPLAEMPRGVSPEKWRYGWDNPNVWAGFDEAMLFSAESPSNYDGLCYVLHPGGDVSEKERLVCLDFDHAIDEDGTLDGDVREFIAGLGTFVEISVSGRGVHAFVLVTTKPFKNALQRPFGGCKVDILCSSQVAVTGNVLGEYRELASVSMDVIEQFSLKEQKAVDADVAEVWSEAFESKGSTDHLVEHMEDWEPCYRSSKGSNLGSGGDVEMFRAACHLARHGVTGDEALHLLAYVPADPPFSTDELRHKIESAFRSVHADEGEFGKQSAEVEFDDIPGATPPTLQDIYGFNPIKLSDLSAMEFDTGFAVKGLLVDKEGLFIGGREKSFKTGIAADLAVSLATGEPFLNQFDILCEPKRTAFFTAEIGVRAAQALFGRITRSKGLNPRDIDDIFIIERLPTFQINAHTNKPVDPVGLTMLKRFFRDQQPTVAVFDPLYLAMAGAPVGDMYAIGNVLNSISEICREFDIWPIFCHHAKKDSTKEFTPMELTDFYGSGVSAFARQWLLMSHAEPFASGQASLYMNAGGSAAGDCGLWRTEIYEGRSDELLDRSWSVTVTDERDDETSTLRGKDAVLDALKYYNSPQTPASVAMMAKLDQRTAQDILVDLVRERKVTTTGGKFQIEVPQSTDEDGSTSHEF